MAIALMPVQFLDEAIPTPRVIRISAAALHVGQSIDVLLDEPQRWHYSKGGGIAMDVVYADGRITSDLALTRTRWDSMRVVPSADGDA